MNKGYYDSPIGMLEIKEVDGAIVAINFIDKDLLEKETLSDEIKKCKNELQEYFNGDRRDFTVKIDFLKGTDFQRSVWKALRNIEYGKTVSYKDIAENIGNSKAVRAVGGANNKNPIMIIVPCHRVIGKNGKLTGYAGGLDAKEYLINLEKK